MKNVRVNISLYVIIPLIFGGISILSSLVTYKLLTYRYPRGTNPTDEILIWGSIITGFSIVSGYLIVKLLIDPVKQFVAKTKMLPVVRTGNPYPPIRDDADVVETYSHLFNQVSDLLSKVDASELFPDIVGQSRSMRGAFNQIMKVAATDSTVLILGETGTGKELVAKSVHQHSARKSKPFIAINCAAIPDGLLESELFGHEKGAFTGAAGRKKGKFEMADGGTIFMDEIGDMALETQAKVLRAIQEGQIERVGGVETISVDIRIIAATNKDLVQMVQLDTFRQDLYFRLNVFPILLPPLKDRREDIPLLIDHFLKKMNKKIGITSDTLQILMAYDWPGNVRELLNVLEGASIVAQSDSDIEPNHLPIPVTSGQNRQRRSTDVIDLGSGLDHHLRDLEKRMIIDALTRCGGVQVRTAQMLGIKERSLWHRLKKYNISAGDYRK
ncbi:MAG: sigma-54-dependent Fis family transcriptional regulator [Desulfobacteraceae bacterium]|nr:sigma-54-dependent Fis family transcriptional regulator [Desulfobacteraceae bacterium]